jgi:hypothetical protein
MDYLRAPSLLVHFLSSLDIGALRPLRLWTRIDNLHYHELDVHVAVPKRVAIFPMFLSNIGFAPVVNLPRS